MTEPAGTITVIDPATEEPIGEVAAGSADDVDRAVRAAADAQEAWGRTPPAERAALLDRIADELERRQEELVDILVAEIGTPLAFAQRVQTAVPIRTLRGCAALAAEVAWDEPHGEAVVRRAPAGVVGAITPWNVPLHQTALKMGPALLAGCTFVLKPSEVAPLHAVLLAEAVAAAGAPPGVFGLVTGDATAGEALVRHPAVDVISFTGSSAAGRRISELAAATVKRVALEMGGKSASVLLPDADVDAAIDATLQRCFMNSGQACVALSRLLVPADQHDDVAARVGERAAAFSVGPPRSGAPIGPLVSDRQRARVRALIDGAIDDGATLVTGGSAPPEGLDRGFYVRPTVFADVDPDARLAQEEVFGPVLAVVPYRDEDDAVRIANGTPYGLSGAVWSADVDLARAVARRLRTGEVLVNGAMRPEGTPFGGFKQSGLGREGGRFGLDEYVELQVIT